MAANNRGEFFSAGERMMQWAATYNAAIIGLLASRAGWLCGTSSVNGLHADAVRIADRAWGDIDTGLLPDDARDQ
jgi:hypothetical protein